MIGGESEGGSRPKGGMERGQTYSGLFRSAMPLQSHWPPGAHLSTADVVVVSDRKVVAACCSMTQLMKL